MATQDVRPFKIAIEESRLQRLQMKLDLTDLPKELESDATAKWSRGPPTAAINKLAQHWIHGYDWRKAEAELNETLPQFMTMISVGSHGDYNVHFVHQKSDSKDAIPLVFLHGWPGSFYEVSKIIKPLTDMVPGGGQSFHVIAPSLLDHGFSEGTRTVRLAGEISGTQLIGVV